MAKSRKSSRRDGRGGWTAGKRRNPDVGDWARILIDLAALINDHYRHGVISGGSLAKVLGCDSKTVCRWLRGEDRPATETQEAVRTWIAERRAELPRAV